MYHTIMRVRQSSCDVSQLHALNVTKKLNQSNKSANDEQNQTKTKQKHRRV